MNLENRTGWAVASLGIAGKRGEPALCVAIEATFDVAAGTCQAAERQPEIDLDGAWHGDPAASSPRSAACSPLPKAGTDCVLLGHAVAPASEVRFRVDSLEQRARIVGNRTWQRRWFSIRPSPPQPWERLPLIWERCCGGLAEPRNPVGRGVVAKGARFSDGLALPNFEHPDHPLRWGRRAPPVGFGWTAPAWSPRRERDAWDPAAMNAAAPELISSRNLNGDESIAVDGVRSDGTWAFKLPGLPPPQTTIVRRRGDLHPSAILDTVAVDADAGTVRLTWRSWSLVDGHELVDAIVVEG